QLVPDRPGLVLAAASHLYPNPKATAERQPFLDKVLALLEKQPAPLKAEELHVKALLHWSAGQETKALAAFQAALAQDPHQFNWRYEFARLLHQEKRLRDARHVLRTVLQQQPGHTQARELLKVVERQIAESM